MKVCSTPDGIEEGITGTLPECVPASFRCSTPDGIEEGITLGNAPPAMGRIGAQRLTASKRESLGGPLVGVIAGECSTPDGIEEGITGPGPNSREGEGMCSTPDGIEEGITFVLKLTPHKI